MSNSHHSREGTASAFGDDFPVLGTAVGGKRSSDNTLQPFLVDDSGNLKVNIIAGGGGTFTNDGTFAKETGGNLAAIKADVDKIPADPAREGGNLATLAGIITSSRAAVNPIVGQAGVQGASGTVTALTQRVVLATDVALPSGTNVIGHVIADSGSTTAVTGNVTVIQGTGTNLHTVVDSGTITVGNGAGASAVNIQDGGNSITVDGAITANAGTNLNTSALALESTQLTGNTSLASIKTNTDNLDVALSTRLKPADTLTKVATVDTITNPVAVTNAGLNNLDVALSTRLKPADTLTKVATVDTITNTVTISGAVTEATLDAALIAQEANTASVKGLTAFGAVTTAAPSYTNNKSDALSLTTAGGLRTDLSTIAGTAPTTAGKIDVKGADGDVFVRQATGTNLHVVVDSGTVTTSASAITLPYAGTTFFPFGFWNAITVPLSPAFKTLSSYVIPAGKTMTIYGWKLRTTASGVNFMFSVRKKMWTFLAVALGAQGAPTLTAKTVSGSGLTLASTYRYKIAAVGGAGKTAASAETSQALAGGQNAMGLSWTAVTGAEYYEVYRTVAGGAVGTEVFAFATDQIAVTDVMPDSQLGAGTPPGSNTTATTGLDGSAFTASFPADYAMVDVTQAITAATALDIVYQDSYGRRRYATATSGTTAATQTLIVPDGLTNPAADTRVPILTANQEMGSLGIVDILGVGTTPATGGFKIYGYHHLIADGPDIGNQFVTRLFPIPVTVPATTEVILSVTAGAAIVTAAAMEFGLLATVA